MLDFLTNLITDVRTLITAAIVVFGIIVGAVIAIKSRSVGGSIMGVFIGAVIVCLPFAIPWAGERLQDDTVNRASSVQEMDPSSHGDLLDTYDLAV